MGLEYWGLDNWKICWCSNQLPISQSTVSYNAWYERNMAIGCRYDFTHFKPSVKWVKTRLNYTLQVKRDVCKWAIGHPGSIEVKTASVSPSARHPQLLFPGRLSWESIPKPGRQGNSPPPVGLDRRYGEVLHGPRYSCR